MDKQETSGTSLISAEDPHIQELQENDERKSLLLRYFGKMSQGSLRGSIFALLASAMGTGVFNLPLRTYQIGVLPFALFIFLGGFFSWIGMVLMIRLITQRKFKSYAEMSETAYGNVLKRISQFCIIIYPWGITICFQVIFAKFVCQLLKDEFGLDLYENRAGQIYNYKGNWVRVITNLICFGFGLIFALKKNISLLQKIAIVGVVSVIFNISTVVIISLVGFTTPQGVKYKGIFHVDFTKVSWFTPNDEGNWKAFSVLAQGIASILFCYVNHQMLFPLSVSLKRPTKKRFAKIINRVHVVEFLAYSIIGITAYLLLLQHIQDQIYIAPVVIASIPTKIMMIGKILMLAALFFAVPLNMFPARQSLFEAFSLQKTNKNHIIVTISMMVSSTAIAMAFINVNSYFGLLGGTAGVLMAGGIPALCYYKLAQKISKFDIVLLVICVLTTILASFGAILSVVTPY